MPFPKPGAGGGLDQLTGDVTAGPGTGSQAATLAVVSTAGTVGDTTHYPIVTIDDKGRVTGMTAQAAPSGLVSSVFTRTGAVVAGDADYLAVATGGLTGAVAATRYVGGTTSGAPTTGTFAVGDFIVDQTGVIWICTTAGTPGTWGEVNGITQLTGDVTAGPGSGSQAATLAAVGTAGTYGSATAVPIVTTDAKGRVTAVTTAAPDDTTKIPLSTVTTTGDLIVGSGAGAVTRLAAGALGDVLTAQGAGVEPIYAAPVAGALSYAESYITANVTLAAATYTEIASVSLATGTWLITARAFASSQASTAQILDLSIGPNSASTTGAYAGANTAPGVAAGESQNLSLSVIKVEVLTATTTVYLNAYASVVGTTIISSDANTTPTVPNMTGITAVKIA